MQENSRGGRIYYSDFQHKGNVGEGQFHINRSTLQIHLDDYLHKGLTYDELLQLLACVRTSRRGVVGEALRVASVGRNEASRLSDFA